MRVLIEMLRKWQTAVNTPSPTAPSLAWNMELPTPGSLDQTDLGVVLNEVLTPEMRENMVRLEKENEILRRRLAESDTVVEEERGSAVVADQPTGGREQGPTMGGRGGGGREGGREGGRGGGEGKVVASLQQQLREKQQRISQLEAVAQESSQSSIIRILADE